MRILTQPRCRVFLAVAAGVFALGPQAEVRAPAAATPRSEEAPPPPGAPGTALPGIAPYAPPLQQRLFAAYEAKGPDYEPRSEHLRPDGTPVYINRLILEDSPYLVQHAHNPVDWFAWGPEAFDKARRENKPVFLSIGYSTCHWCHVMEKESFDHPEVARFLNAHFVAIKVDREQRPDVDEIYMTAVQLMTGSGGWPMSTLLTPQGEPFFGGTYFPREVFMNILRRAREVWEGQNAEVTAAAARVTAAVREATAVAGEATEVGQEVIATAVRHLLARHDSRLGGFSGAPKFPREPELLFLLERVLRTGDREALGAVETSLDRMARGGIHDQVGGGFHRYSTDALWLVPHFEKMLYNQAHLARAYLEAFRTTGNRLYERVARQTLDYVLRDMTSPEGGFYSATDADSEGKEGEFFLWTPEQIRKALPDEDARLASELYGVTEGGNFEGKTILHLPVPLPDFAAARAMSLDLLLGRVDRVRQRLYATREERVHPLRDDKIVTAWTGMMITSLARAADLLGERRYREAAERAASFLWKHNRRADGGLWRAHLGGSSSVEANLEDYAYLAEACVSLYDATAEPLWRERAASLADSMLDRFWDDAEGGFFLSAGDEGGRLITRLKSPADGAIPSANSVAVRALALLASRTGESGYRRKAEASLAAFSAEIRRHPAGYGYLLLAADDLLHGDAGPLDYGALGVVRARAEVAPGGRLTLHLRTADGWHVNAHRPLQEFLIPTELKLAEGSTAGVELAGVRYPEAETVTLGFQQEPLAVYQGSVQIRGTISAGGALRPAIARLSVTIQACDDEKCLKPEDLLVEVPVHPGEAEAGTAGG